MRNDAPITREGVAAGRMPAWKGLCQDKNISRGISPWDIPGARRRETITTEIENDKHVSGLPAVRHSSANVLEPDNMQVRCVTAAGDVPLSADVLGPVPSA